MRFYIFYNSVSISESDRRPHENLVLFKNVTLVLRLNSYLVKVPTLISTNQQRDGNLQCYNRIKHFCK